MAVFDLIAVLQGAHLAAPVAEVRMVVHRGLTAVLSTAPRPFLRLPQSRRDHLTEVASRLQSQEACMALGTVLPTRQGNALTPEAAEAFLAANHPDLTDLFARFAGQVQVQITVSWAEDRVLGRFSHGPELAPIFARGTVDPQDLGRAVQRLVLRLSSAIGAELAAVVTDVAALPLTEGVLWNGAVLLPQHALASLDSAVEAVDAIWSEGLTIRQIGPAPISSFATLDLEPVTSGQIERALDRFGLKGVGIEADIGAMRRQALMSLGPNADGSLREAVRRQARIAEASSQLAAVGIKAAAGFSLCHLLSEGRTAALQDRAVA